MHTKFSEYKSLDLPQVGKAVLEFWKEQKIFQKSISQRQGCPPYVFYEGPPSANGMPGIHHVMARTIKDIFPRYKTMKGYQVHRKAGWDTHGLPVELGVEKELGITKEDIGKKISIEDYNQACKKAVMRYTDVWNQMTEMVGYWVDMEDPYITYKPKYIETVWWLLKQIYDKGLLYKGYTIQPYSPKAGTGLSSHELNQPGTYQDVTDTTVTAQFKYTSSNGKSVAETFGVDNDSLTWGNTYFLAWTTTPWTLPSNTALTVGPKIDYVLVKTFNQYTFDKQYVILAKALLNKQFGKKYFLAETEADFDRYESGQKTIPYQIIAATKGDNLVDCRYEQLLNFALPYQNPENAFRVIKGDFVTTEDGTGIVHTAPTFGADDAMVAKLASPPVPPMLVLDENQNPVPLVDLQGKFRPELGDLGGKYVKNEYYPDGEAPEKSVDVEIAIRLKTENKAFNVEKYVHSYPNCWRTDKPILYYPLDSWFIKITEVRERMTDLNQSINWKPAATGEGRFGNWLANANDWNLSRSRYWGIPLPIWRSEDGTEECIIGSVEELKKEMQKAVDAGFMEKDLFEGFVVGDMSELNYEQIDLHKNIVDDIILVSPTGKPMKRESDLIDVWFDSGAMPYAQWHYPFENKDYIDKNEVFPADFIAEGVDQTRGWFYTLHAIGTLVFDNIAYKNVVSNGLVLDKDGKKMSKRLGNAIDPFEALPEHGADAIRWYMIVNANPWDNLKFNIEGVQEVKRKFFGTLYNTYSFFALYANIDGFSFAQPDIEIKERPELDQWILSELNSLILKVDQAYTDYEPTRAARAIDYFVQTNLSNWYVRLSRRRFWKPATQFNAQNHLEHDKICAYQTLYTCLVTVAKLAAPIAPFFTDQLFRDLNVVTKKEDTESVHLTIFPKINEHCIDPTLEAKMQTAQKLTSLVLSIRQKEKIKVRQPLKKMMVPVLNDAQKETILSVAELVKSEVNVKELDLVDDASGIIIKTIKPNFKTLGPKFGKDMKTIANAIMALNQKDIQKIEQEGEINLDIDTKSFNLKLSDFDISSQDIEGWLVANEGNLTVALDITLNENLKNEGIARELVNRIQNLRKDSGFEVTDKINITLKNDSILNKALLDFSEYVKRETLTVELLTKETIEDAKPLEFENVKSEIKLEKI